MNFIYEHKVTSNTKKNNMKQKVICYFFFTKAKLIIIINQPTLNTRKCSIQEWYESEIQ